MKYSKGMSPVSVSPPHSTDGCAGLFAFVVCQKLKYTFFVFFSGFFEGSYWWRDKENSYASLDASRGASHCMFNLIQLRGANTSIEKLPIFPTQKL